MAAHNVTEMRRIASARESIGERRGDIVTARLQAQRGRGKLIGD
jgi:hypothetical protein